MADFDSSLDSILYNFIVKKNFIKIFLAKNYRSSAKNF